jgi:hypothetical protein
MKGQYVVNFAICRGTRLRALNPIMAGGPRGIHHGTRRAARGRDRFMTAAARVGGVGGVRCNRLSARSWLLAI